MANPRVFFDMTVCGALAGRIVMELYANEVGRSWAMVPMKRKRITGAVVVATVVKWKVGDLVLTKMKTFPAWPAMVLP
ncbi:Peptidyl-prolyl cis-trans isomerase [Zea mays]|uniref:Peptidyl-prolyl cis-trans isomerase n=1 Tax=Zea mays TaxID=4577 RepID=A0A3L6EYQ5_MAIZE|nr:Peptidyl-prolyl cis-trans isomerase [Zea mays]